MNIKRRPENYPHRVLAINRGEKEEILSVKLVLEEEKVYGIIKGPEKY